MAKKLITNSKITNWGSLWRWFLTDIIIIILCYSEKLTDIGAKIFKKCLGLALTVQGRELKISKHWLFVSTFKANLLRQSQVSNLVTTRGQKILSKAVQTLFSRPDYFTLSSAENYSTYQHKSEMLTQFL